MIFMQDEKTEVPWVLEYTSCLLFLAVFGILGVMYNVFYFESSKYLMVIDAFTLHSTFLPSQIEGEVWYFVNVKTYICCRIGPSIFFGDWLVRKSICTFSCVRLLYDYIFVFFSRIPEFNFVLIWRK